MRGHARADGRGGFGWGRLAEAYVALGRHEDARAALQRGVDASYRYGHVGMANDLEARIEELDDV